MYDHFAMQHLVGQSHWTERTRRRILQASRYSYGVLITGPAGSGKHLIARAIHAHSRRADQPLIPFHCGQLPAALTSYQLFGHPAAQARLAQHATLGCIGAAQGGTLVLREVGDLDLDAQDRLLEVIRDKRARRVGEEVDRPADIRIIATSSRDLREAARRGEFRVPLLYLLGAISVDAAPLTERPEDIAPLARHILARVTFERGLAYRPLTAPALALLQAYDWPGNVAEMEQVLEHAVISSDAALLDLEDFPELFAAVKRQVGSALPTKGEPEAANELEAIPDLPAVAGQWPSLKQMEAAHLKATMRRAGQSLAVAARLLGMDVAVLRAKLVQHRLHPPLLPSTIPDTLA